VPTGIDGIQLGATGTTSWYVVDVNVTNTNRPTVQGDVNLILADAATWTADYSSGGVHWGGISVPSGNSLTIWGQTAGTGTLNTCAY